MGNVSREARLLFIQLWTVADDAGRLRDDPRYLAYALYPRDDDAERHIRFWLGELERQECIRQYRNGCASFIAVTNWLRHQKIAHPTRSRIAAPPAAEQFDLLGHTAGFTEECGRQSFVRINGGRA